MEELSIIIPTYNRIELLKRVLLKLDEQDYDLKDVEVIVFDDCSLINPGPIIKKMKLKYKLRFFRMKKNSGQGIVRNSATKLAKGRFILFLGDDMIPEKNLIEEHMKLLKNNKGIAVLGRVFWAEELRNEFMNFVEGIQFHYNNIKDKNNVKLHFYTSNISLEKSWFDNEEYNKKFKNYGFEDIELGYRLEKKGLRVIYNPKAIVYHYHEYNFEQFCNRMKNVGKSAVIFCKLHPELKGKYAIIFPLDKIIKLGSFILSKKLFKYLNIKLYWYSNFVYYYMKGVEEEIECGKIKKFQ